MNKYKKLIGNSFVFAIGNFGSKIMQFVMVPIYSYTLTATDFGKADFLTNLVALFAPIVCLDIYDAVFRFALDNDENKQQILNTGFLFTLIISVGSIIVGKIVSLYVHNYPVYLTVFLLIFTVFYSLVSNYARAIGFVKKYAVAGIINTFVMGIMNILLLVVLKRGLNGYIFSMVFALFSASVYILFSTKVYRSLTIKGWNTKKFKEMCKYSLPLIPNSLAWWLNSTSDRFFIIMFLGAKWNGIYAMSNKIPNMLSTLTNIFFQSWQMSAVQEYNSKDSKQFITNVFGYFTSFMFCFSILIMIFIKPLFRILLSSQYYTGWKLTPLVLLTVIYSSLSGFLGTMYTATKKTFPIFLTTVEGAIINVILSLLLIPHFGIYGASVANIASFLLVTIVRLIDIHRENKIEINLKRLLLLHALFITVSLLIFFVSNNYIIIAIGLLLFLLQVVLDKNIKNILHILFRKLKSYKV